MAVVLVVVAVMLFHVWKSIVLEHCMRVLYVYKNALSCFNSFGMLQKVNLTRNFKS